MQLFKKSHDGGKDSGVTSYWLIEWKEKFSIVLLHFSPGTRDAFHSHAFNALTWWLKGSVVEEYTDGYTTEWRPSIKPKRTPRNVFHKIIAGEKGAWALSFRGPWSSTWQEHKDGATYTLSHGRKRVEGTD